MNKSQKQEMIYELNQNCDVHTTLDIAKDETAFSLEVLKITNLSISDFINFFTILEKCEFSFQSKYMNEKSTLGTFYVSQSGSDKIINLQVKILTEKYVDQ